MGHTGIYLMFNVMIYPMFKGGMVFCSYLNRVTLLNLDQLFWSEQHNMVSWAGYVYALQ